MILTVKMNLMTILGKRRKRRKRRRRRRRSPRKQLKLKSNLKAL